MSDCLTREEIAEIVSAGVRLHTPRGEYYALEVADALLARLRPAWEVQIQWEFRYNDLWRWLPQMLADRLDQFCDGADAMYVECASDEERVGYTTGRASLIGQIRREGQNLRPQSEKE